VLPLQEEGPHEERVPRAFEAVKKRVSPAEKITTANRFSALQGLEPDPPEPPDPPDPPGPGSAPASHSQSQYHRDAPSPKTPRSTCAFTASLRSSNRKSPAKGSSSSSSSQPTHHPLGQLVSSDPLTSPPEQINQLTNPGHPLIKVAGTVAGHSAVALLDCGATGLFISSRFVADHALGVSSTSSDTITLADGRSQRAAGVLSSVSVAFGSYSDDLDFTVTDLHGYDLILGMPWLVHYNPVIDWRGATVSFVDQHSRACVLRRIATGVAPWRPSPSPPSFSAARVSTIVR
jgi:hypothetical protein